LKRDVIDLDELPGDVSAHMLVRRAVSAFLRGVGSARFLADAQLLTSELVSNSIRHAGLTERNHIGLGLDLSDVASD
jgi:anti-sigma regulatory factor (Ser/Thr protein kinase)